MRKGDGEYNAPSKAAALGCLVFYSLLLALCILVTPRIIVLYSNNKDIKNDIQTLASSLSPPRRASITVEHQHRGCG